MIWAILSRMLLLVVAELLLQDGKALWAASSAKSMSSFPERAALVKALPSMGERLSKYSPFTGGTNCPPM